MLLSTYLNQEDDSKPPDVFTLINYTNKILYQLLLQGQFIRNKTNQTCKLLLFEEYLLMEIGEKCYRADIDLSIGLKVYPLKQQFSFRYVSESIQSWQNFTIENSKTFYIWLQLLSSRFPMIGFNDQYVIFQQIGTGKNSKVFKAIKQLDKKPYAVKVTPMSTGVKQEIQILSQLEHPNLVHFREFYIEMDQAYIVMDYQDGGNLLDKIREEEPLSPRSRIKIFTDVLNGLEFLRIKGVVHRDIKPQNILYSKKDGNYKIGDFGLATKVNTSLDKIVGTPGYIAPQLFNKKDQDQLLASIKSDIYSAGLIFYETITKEPFNKGSNPKQILENNMKTKNHKNIKHQNILELERDLLVYMLRKTPQKRKDSYQILTSSVINKLIHEYNFPKKTTTDSTRKSNSHDQQLQSSGFMTAVKNLLKIRSSSS